MGPTPPVTHHLINATSKDSEDAHRQIGPDSLSALKRALISNRQRKNEEARRPRTAQRRRRRRTHGRRARLAVSTDLRRGGAAGTLAADDFHQSTEHNEHRGKEADGELLRDEAAFIY